MSLLEINKIIASIIIGIVLFFAISFIGNKIVNINNQDNQELAYKIDIPESNESSVINQETSYIAEPISNLLQNASLEDGKKIYKKCATCHNYEKNSSSKVGPNLWNLINRPKAYVSDFTYSKALVDSGGIWNFEELNNFLYKPKEYIQGTKMNFSGLKKVEDRANLILWLRKQSDNPVTLP